MAQGDYYNIDIDTCNELTVSYYNGGEFFNPLRDVYYKYVTNDGYKNYVGAEKSKTDEFLEYLNTNVIHPMFDLPDQSSFEDIKEIEDLIVVGEDANE